MILRARQEGNVVVLELEGQLDFETTFQFRETCLDIMKKTKTNQLVFNMEKLKFVGSSGINQFIKVLKEFNAKKEKPKFIGVSVEFTKLVRAYQAKRHPVEILDTKQTARQSIEAIGPKRTKGRLLNN